MLGSVVFVGLATTSTAAQTPRRAGTWNVETVDTNLRSFGGHPSLALTSPGWPAISYNDK